MDDDGPTRCRNGHPFGPYKVLVGFRHCQCPGAGVSGGHHTYRCRVAGCGDVIVWGCTDPTQLANYQPGPAK